MKTTQLALFALLAITATPSLAKAQETPAPSAPVVAGDDEVVLKDGTALRGRLIHVDTDKSISIVVAGSNDLRTIPWASVARVEQNKYAPNQPQGAPTAPTAPPAAAPQAAPTAPPMDKGPLPLGVVRMHLDTSDQELQLYRWGGVHAQVGGGHTGVNTDHKLLCYAPCDSVVDGRDGVEFLLSRRGVPWATPFRIDSFQGDLTIKPHAGDKTLQNVGFGVGAAGALAFASGLVALLGGVILASSSDSPTRLSTAADVKAVGGTMMGVSLLPLLGGGLMYYAGRNRFEILPMPASP
jgi:hypothetical protein